MRYPVWEMMMERNNHYFNSIIVCFTPGEILREDYSSIVKREMKKKIKNIVFLDYPNIKGDWRHVSVNHALNNSSAEVVLFMEQDIIIPHLSIINTGGTITMVIKENERIHPAFLRVKREEIEKTDKNFAPIPEKKLDHFDYFTSQLTPPFIEIHPKLYYHLAGYTDNCRLEYEGKKPNFKPEEFKLFKIMEQLYELYL